MDKLMLEKKAKTKCLSMSLLCYLTQNQRVSQSSLNNAFMKWKNLSTSSRIAHNAFNKILKINHKHISARIQAAFLLLSTVSRSNHYDHKLTAFKNLVRFAILQNNYNKPAIIRSDHHHSKSQSHVYTQLPIVNSKQSEELVSPHDHYPSRQVHQPHFSPIPERLATKESSTIIYKRSSTPNERSASDVNLQKVIKNSHSPLSRGIKSVDVPLNVSG
jgi:hypothetical protein